MKVGLYLATQWVPGTDLGPQLGNLLAQVRLARQAGFKSLWVAHHYVVGPDMQMFQPTQLLARLMAEADGMMVGPAILLLSMMNPVVVAEESATLDWLCDGNYVLPVGIGYRPEEFAVMDVPMPERAGRFVESIKLMRRLWTEEKVEHRGKYFTVPNVGLSLKPKRPGGPPIWIGASVDAAIKRAATLGDAWLASFTVPFDTLRTQYAMYDATRAEAGLGAPDDKVLCREIYVGADDRTALDECRAALTFKYKAYASWRNPDMDAEQADRDFDAGFEKMARSMFIVGDAARVKDELARYRETLGITHFVARMQWPGLAQDKVMASIERFGDALAS